MQSTNISQLIKGIEDTQRELNALKKAQECCFVVGLTGAGKSTITSCICGGQVKYGKKSGRFIIDHKDPKLPVIGNEMESETKIPGFFTTPDNMVIYDPPGYLGTSGVFQQILDSYCNAKMFRVGSKIRIVIMIEMESLTASRGGGLVEIATQLHKLFGKEFKNVINSCLLIVSKTNEAVMTMEEIIQNIGEIQKDNKKLTVEGAMLIKTLIKQKKIIGFPIPPQWKNDTVDTIKTNIKNIPLYHIIEEPFVSLSADGKIAVQGLVKHINKNKNNLIEVISLELVTVFKTNMKNKQVLEDNLLKLRSAKKMLQARQLQSGIPGKIEQIQKKLSIRQDRIDKFKEWISQVKFCFTIYPDIKLPITGSQDLLISIAEIQGELELQLSKIVTQEQIKKLNDNHKAAIKHQQIIFKTEFETINKKATDDLNAIRLQSEENNKKYMDELIKGNQGHMRQMAKLNQQLVQLANRPPTIIHHHEGGGGGGCQIM